MDFDTLMEYVQMPMGCRHAQLTQHFAKDSQAAAGAHLDGICHGGCDICDFRVAALRDLSEASHQVLRALHSSPNGLSPQAIAATMVCPH